MSKMTNEEILKKLDAIAKEINSIERINDDDALDSMRKGAKLRFANFVYEYRDMVKANEAKKELLSREDFCKNTKVNIDFSDIITNQLSEEAIEYIKTVVMDELYWFYKDRIFHKHGARFCIGRDG